MLAGAAGGARLDAVLLRRFRSMLQRVDGASIVLVSDWRTDPALLAMVRREIDILDTTPVLPGRSRGVEIQMWPDQHPLIDEFVILDDCDDFLLAQRHHLVRTTMTEGLTVDSADEVVALFARGALRLVQSQAAYVH